MARLLLLFLPLLPASLLASPIPDPSRALLLAVPESWNSRHTNLQLYRRDSASAPWVAKNPPIPVNLGRRGLAWGRGRVRGWGSSSLPCSGAGLDDGWRDAATWPR